MTDAQREPAEPAEDFEYESEDDAIPTDLGTITDGELLDDEPDEVNS